MKSNKNKSSIKKINNQTPLLEMKQVSKSFFDKVINKNINLTLRKGEIIALLGENGAGKSTLMKILYGLYSKDSGSIYIKGYKNEFKSPKDAIKSGIGMVHQHFTLVNDLTVTENVILGLKQTHNIFLNINEAAKNIIKFSEKYGIKIDPYKKISQLSVGERQRVEILKVLYRKANILILDEPTAVLTPQETEELFKNLKSLTKEGKGVIFITHKLEEVMSIADRIIVLKNGNVVLEKNISESNVEDLAIAMIGRKITKRYDISEQKFGKTVLNIFNLKTKNDDGINVLNSISFRIREGEILGLAGVSGNGQRELSEVLSGTRRITSGEFSFCGENMNRKPPRELFQKGIGRIPEDRMEIGTMLDFPLKYNLILEAYYSNPFSNRLIMNDKEIQSFTKKLVSDFSIKAHNINIEAETLSGGNLQKVILARVLSNNPKLIIASQPIRGLDVGAAEYIHSKLIEARDKKAAILLISEDLDEIISIADTIGVIYKGQITGIFSKDEVDIQTIGLLMAGIVPSPLNKEIT